MFLNLTGLTYTQSLLTNNFNTIKGYLIYIDLMTRRLCDAEIYVSMCDHYVDSLSTLSHIIHRMRHLISCSSHSTTGYILIHTRIESRVSKRYLHIYIHSTIFHHSQEIGATQVSMDRWMDKQYSRDTRILFNLKKEGNSDPWCSINEFWSHLLSGKTSSHKRISLV